MASESKLLSHFCLCTCGFSYLSPGGVKRSAFVLPTCPYLRLSTDITTVSYASETPTGLWAPSEYHLLPCSHSTKHQVWCKAGTNQMCRELMEGGMESLSILARYPQPPTCAECHFSPAPTRLLTLLLSNPRNFTFTVVYDRACFLHLTYPQYSVLSNMV